METKKEKKWTRIMVVAKNVGWNIGLGDRG
jgi:hypothetical protein